MSNVALFNAAGDRSGSMELPAGLLADRVHTHVIWEAVKSHLANQRQGTHKTKTRHEVSGQKSKLYKQKGTGRARAGSATTGIRVGGGRIHGPRPRNYAYRIPAQVRQLAVRSALASRAKKDSLFVVEGFGLEGPKTKALAAALGKMGITDRKVLVVSGTPDRNLVLSGRNLPNAVVTHAGELNAYMIMWAHTVVLTKDAVQALGEVYAA